MLARVQRLTWCVPAATNGMLQFVVRSRRTANSMVLLWPCFGPQSRQDFTLGTMQR